MLLEYTQFTIISIRKSTNLVNLTLLPLSGKQKKMKPFLPLLSLFDKLNIALPYELPPE